MFQSAGAAAFFTAWKALCVKTPVPHYREAFQLLSTEIIPHLLIVEEVGEQHVIRFMGTARAESWGGDLTGKNGLAVMKPKLALAARRNLKTMCEHPCGMHHVSSYPTISGREAYMENITVPVSNDPGRPRRLLNFIDELAADRYSGPDGEVRSAVKSAWLDIGAGVPKKQPAK